VTKSRAIFSSYFGVLLFSGFIFLGAWRIAYWQGLLYVLVALLGVTLNHLTVPKGSDLTDQRASRVWGGEKWDKRILGALSLVSIVTFVVAGLDSGRFGWSGIVPIKVTIAGVVLMVAGQILFALAKRENAFFSSTAEIQSDRGHRICETGPYRFVRHPGYLGMLISQLAFPLVLQSYWAFLPTAVGTLLLIVRALLEDRYLMDRLGGYRGYAARTRWRLFPRVF